MSAGNFRSNKDEKVFLVRQSSDQSVEEIE